MNPLLIWAIISLAALSTLFTVCLVIIDRTVREVCLMLSAVVMLFFGATTTVTALLLNKATVSVKLWNQQHNTNYSATEWFYAEREIKGDEQ